MEVESLCYTCMYVLANLFPLFVSPYYRSKWHPFKSSIASTTNQGNILIWHCPTPERWGAFAGGFEEVDENVEYEEREDEFDIVSRKS
jgi:hypothetical protein